MTDILAGVRKAFNEAFDVDPESISVDTTPEDVEKWDSMGHVSLVSALESIFGVNFDVDDLMEMENVQEIIRVVKSKI